MFMVIDNRHAQVSCDRRTLITVWRDGSKQRTPIRLLENLVIVGNVLVESRVWLALAEAGVPATLLPARGGQRHAALASGLSVTLPLRRQQYRCAETPAAALAVARWVVQSKLESYSLPLQRLRGSHPSPCEKFARQRARALEKLASAKQVDSLMGLEGAVANAWFALLSQCIPAHWRFEGRNRRPPRDPVNAMLSLGYTLLMSDVRQMLHVEGLDPALGFLHQQHPGREALALDLCELFRAAVDDFVLDTLEQLSPDQFSRHAREGCRLTKAARPVFYTAWGYRREAWPRLAANDDGKRLHGVLRERIRGRIAALRRVIDQSVDKYS